MLVEFGLETSQHSLRYPLLKKNLAYAIRRLNPAVNAFVLRPSSELMNFNDRKLAIAYRMAQIISQQFDNDQGIRDKDISDLRELGFGYIENQIPQAP